MYDGRYDADAAIEAKATLEKYYPAGAISLLIASGTTIVPLAQRTRYRDASPALRRLGADVDAWPVRPAGLFVVQERSIYLRSVSPMTVCHEAAHALDCALGGGVYLSAKDARIRRAFDAARSFVTPYAASGLDEYFAECVRAMVEANDRRCPWPMATRERLRRLDPTMQEIISGLFERIEREHEDRRKGEQMALGLSAA